MLNRIGQALKSKTVRFAILIAVLSVLQGFVFLLPITPMMQMLVGIAIAVAVVVLRSVTSVPLSEK